VLKRIDAKEIDKLLFVNSMSGEINTNLIMLIKKYKPEFEVIINKILQNNDHLTTIKENTWFPNVFTNVERALEFANIDNKEQILTFLFLIYLDEYNVSEKLVGYPKNILTKYMKEFNIERPKPSAKNKKQINYKHTFIQISSPGYYPLTKQQSINGLKRIDRFFKNAVEKWIKFNCRADVNWITRKVCGYSFQVEIVGKFKTGEEPRNFDKLPCKFERIKTNHFLNSHIGPMKYTWFTTYKDVNLVIDIINKMSKFKSRWSEHYSSPRHKNYESIEDFIACTKMKKVKNLQKFLSKR